MEILITCLLGLSASYPTARTWPSNTAKINSVSTIKKFVRQSSEDGATATDAFSGWSWIYEPVGISSDNAFTKPGLLEQINTTADQSDYLWYSLSFETKGDEPFLNDGSQTVLHVDSLGHALNVFINGKLAGSGKGRNSDSKVSLDVPIGLVAGKNKIDLLSLTVGLQNYGAFFDLKGAGINGPVQLKGLKNGSTVDLSSQQWTYQIGLKGEGLGVSTGSSSLWQSQRHSLLYQRMNHWCGTRVFTKFSVSFVATTEWKCDGEAHHSYLLQLERHRAYALGCQESSGYAGLCRIKKVQH